MQKNMTKRLFNHILLADDDIDDCDFFAEAVRDQFPDMKLSIMHDGAKLISLLENPQTPKSELVFLDLNMPIMSGEECLIKIRNSDALKKHIIIVFSTSSNTADIEKMYSLGANYFITKPVVYSHLSILIKKALSLVSQPDNLQPAFENFHVKI
ncbi:response regulator [Flavobacterium sp. H4147]|uniref:response regulator n=1 Tax=Flavobacterium sp. H4147 TaxID=3034149 RepID=UPI0023EBF8CB|nr:response regulator [Flavobacterium sp. H4147]